MQEKQILQHTKQAMELITPDCFDAIWERASNANPDEYPLPDDPLVIKKTKTVPKKWIAGLSVLAACLLCFFGFRWYENYAIYTTINLDVNPSIRICINRQEKILSISGLNTDGKKVVDALYSPTHRPLDEVVEETIFELAKAGYLTMDDANAILVSVETGNTSNAEELMDDLSKHISAAMGNEEVYGEIISQQMPRDDKEVDRIAEQLHISQGKATLIRNMTLENGNFSEKDLADMKINEILETAEKECVDMSSFVQPARLHDVPAPKDSRASSGKKDGSATEKSTGDAKDADKNTQDNSAQSNQGMKQDGTTASGKKQKTTETPKATEKPKTTTAPKSDSDKKSRDSEKQQNTQREPDGSEQREADSDRRDSSVSGTANPGVTTAPEPTSADEDRKQRPEVTHHPDVPRHPRHPRYPGFPHDEDRK